MIAFIIPRFDGSCTVYRIIEIIQLALINLLISVAFTKSHTKPEKLLRTQKTAPQTLFERKKLLRRRFLSIEEQFFSYYLVSTAESLSVTTSILLSPAWVTVAVRAAQLIFIDFSDSS